MKLSIFTPTHDPKWLLEAYASIKDQPFDEWVIVQNRGGGDKLSELLADPRVKYYWEPSLPQLVGALKKRACQLCTGDWLLELDHDDELLPGACAVIRKAAEENPNAAMIYSNAAHVNMDGSPRPRWVNFKYDQIGWNGNVVDVPKAYPPLPSTVARIWYAPDHVRVFNAQLYRLAGGHRDDMRVLDDLDLMCRLFKVGRFVHIDAALYVYRVHGENTFLKFNAEIQNNVHRIFETHILEMAMVWSAGESLMRLNLGAGAEKIPGLTAVDTNPVDDDVLRADLDQRWPFLDNSVGVVRSYDCFEHLRNSIHTMKELWRVLVPNGIAIIQVPSTDGRGAFQDPTHVSFWNENSFLYYTHSSWARFIGTPVRFQNLLTYTTPADKNGVKWTRAYLLKLDSTTTRPPGPIDV